ncbi:hypothetical protein EMIHUDRAFT_434451 [Emiliania huxleyi CCMP1516]|uniref:Thioredoxin domain-containing protein n=3 Tax=Emiliania huxleyi TaxID=2903 RepID=A0A0D3K2I3_EMIH1|nr:hypothetical protein EMIHUDRAFT_434451 [Emiliania huxleyi CCMP1516]EOD29968.1 hypothetical protein EMIHUDRAFT_434451 [Emiliania huxleyi CCMP1516]|eukprot:XP_005782397.1 hypothetical protein EMIHUDRAFT_434451 [Emiliania huxleyi CCMP1516]
MSVVIPSSASEADAALASGSCVANFCATWCEPCTHMNAVFAELASEGSNAALRFVQIDCDAFPELCERHGLESVPAFLFLHGGAVTDTLTGASAPDLALKVRQNALTASIHTDAVGAPPAAVPIEERCRQLTSRAPVVLFMKGSPAAPRCGFSRKICELLTEQKVSFDSFDILADEEVRQGLKQFSNWPTYPQLYADGKLLGGLDIVRELAEEDELLDSIPAAAKAA